MKKLLLLIFIAGLAYPGKLLAQVVSGTTYKLINQSNGGALDVNAGGTWGTYNGVNVQTWTDIGSVAQKWQMVDNGDGSWSLFSPNSQKVLDVDQGGNSSAGNAQIWSFFASDGQKWEIITNGDGTISLKHSSGKVLGIKVNSTNVELVANLGSNRQKWLPVEVSAIDPTLDLSNFTLLRDYTFGSDASRAVNDISDLSVNFEPYGIAGTNVINNEWQRYQPFNTTNHHFTSTRLELTAVPDLGGIYNGGISSGQITSKETFYPSGDKVYVFQLRAKIPHGEGTWPAFWMYSPGGSGSTSSEIDIVEFFNSDTQDTYDWTGFDHGAGVGGKYYSIMTNKWVWHPGFDFADDYHVYTLVWKEGSIQKWVDDTVVKGSLFGWFGPAPQVLVNLALGGNPNNPPNAAETPFPSKFILDYFRVYEYDPSSSARTSTGALNKNDLDIRVFPNPAEGSVTISGVSQALVEVFNVSGVKLKSVAYTDQSGLLEINDLAKGTYLIKVTSEGASVVERILVK